MCRKGIWLLLWVLSLPAWAETFVRFEEKGKVGLKDESGNVLLPATFQALGWSDGNFSVIGQVTGYKLKEKWGVINLQKKFITPADYESMTYSGGDRIIAARRLNPFTVKFGCLDFEGKVVVPFNYDGISISGLRAIVSVRNGIDLDHGVIDLNDKSIIALKYKHIVALGTLRYAVENKNQRTALFTEEGHQLTPFTIDSISAFHHGLSIVYQNFAQGIIDREGEIKVPANYRAVAIQDDGSILVREFDQWSVLDDHNRELNRVVADDLTPAGENLYAVSLAGKHGLSNNSLSPVLSKSFDNLEMTDGKCWIVRTHGKYGVIRKDSTWILPPRFDAIRSDGLFIRSLENLNARYGWSVYDTFGIRKTAIAYDEIGPYNGSYFLAKKRGYWGAVNRYGEEFLKCVFDSIVEAKGNLLVVKFHGQPGIITREEKWMIAPQSNSLGLINDDLYFEKSDTITFVKNFQGGTVYFTPHPISFDGQIFREALLSGSEKLISLQGQELAGSPKEPDSEGIIYYRESEGFRRIMKDGKFGFVDDQGRLRLANRYDDAGDFHEGLAAIKLIGHWGFVNDNDVISINPYYDAVQAFHKGVAVVKRSEKFGLIDKNGKALLPLRYDSIELLSDELYLLSVGPLHGLADGKGNVLIEARYDKLMSLENGYVLVSRDGKSGVLTRDGLSIIPIQYDQLAYDNKFRTYRALKQSTWKVFK